jgi:hypothetical protein
MQELFCLTQSSFSGTISRNHLGNGAFTALIIKHINP